MCKFLLSFIFLISTAVMAQEQSSEQPSAVMTPIVSRVALSGHEEPCADGKDTAEVDLSFMIRMGDCVYSEHGVSIISCDSFKLTRPSQTTTGYVIGTKIGNVYLDPELSTSAACPLLPSLHPDHDVAENYLSALRKLIDFTGKVGVLGMPRYMDLVNGRKLMSPAPYGAASDGVSVIQVQLDRFDLIMRLGPSTYNVRRLALREIIISRVSEGDTAPKLNSIEMQSIDKFGDRLKGDDSVILSIYANDMLISKNLLSP